MLRNVNLAYVYSLVNLNFIIIIYVSKTRLNKNRIFRNGYYGSAVCAFALEEINTVFSGSFSDPKNGNLPVPGAMVPTTELGQVGSQLFLV